MFLLHFLSDGILEFIINGLLLSGVVGTLLSFFVINRVLRWIPSFSAYYHIVQIASIFLLATGIYLKGGYNTELEWRKRVDIAKKQVAEAEQKAIDASKQVKIEYVDKIETVKDVQVVLKDRIVKVKEKINSECTLDPEVPKILNDAARDIRK